MTIEHAAARNDAWGFEALARVHDVQVLLLHLVHLGVHLLNGLVDTPQLVPDEGDITPTVFDQLIIYKAFSRKFCTHCSRK